MSKLQVSDLPIHSKASLLYENEKIFVLAKPDGVLSQPNKNESQSFSILLAPYNEKTESFETRDHRHVYLIHRIDKETSGCLLFAKDAQTAKQLKKDFLEHNIQKQYIGLVAGLQKQPTTWKDHLAKDSGKVRFDPQKKPNAETGVEPIQVFDQMRMTLLRMSPKSGKTHQLRVQAAKRNLHILGDRQYGNFQKNKEIRTKYLLKRMFLHANQLTFIDPSNKKEITVKAPLPQELEFTLEKIKSQNSS